MDDDQKRLLALLADAQRDLASVTERIAHSAAWLRNLDNPDPFFTESHLEALEEEKQQVLMDIAQLEWDLSAYKGGR